MWELDYKESWAPKNAFELWWWRRLESPLDCKEIQPVHPKGNQSWIFTGRTDAEAETPNTSATWWEELTHLKRPWCWEGLKAGGEGDDRGWDSWMASPTQWTWVWVGDRQGGLACCSPWGHKVLDMTERLNWTLENCSWGFPWLCSKRIDYQRMGEKHEFLKVMAQVHKPGYWIAWVTLDLMEDHWPIIGMW